MFTFGRRHRNSARRTPAKPRSNPRLETLEERCVLYSASGNLWGRPELITLSFVPDGTVLSSGGVTSNLQATWNAKFGLAAAWQKEILRAAQTWARYTNINFAIVSDNGTAAGGGSNQQGDPGFGDIRIGGYNFGTSTLAQAFAAPPVNNYSIAGDIQFNTGQNFNLNTTYHLYSVAVHEIGHALGLNHSNISSAVLYASYMGIKTDLHSDDSQGIRSMYSAGAARSEDVNDQGGGDNDKFQKATVLTGALSNLQFINNNLDLSLNNDLDFYTVVAPSGTSSTMKVKVQSQGLSLLSPKFTVYAANQTTVLGSATASGDYDGSTLSLTISGVTAGAQYYIKVEGAETQATPSSWQSFNTGKYALSLNFGTGADPAVTLPNTLTPNGAPIQYGGGQATIIQDEFRVNASTTNYQGDPDVAVAPNGSFVVVYETTVSNNRDVYAQRYDANGVALGAAFRVNTYTSGDQDSPDIAMDANGNFTIVWESAGQDGSSEGVYAQRYNASGVAQGSEFRVNTYTTNAQEAASIAMADNGNFVVAWESYTQDGGLEGIYAKRFNATGVVQGSEFRVNTYTSGDQEEPDVSMGNAGNFIVVWTSINQDGSADGIYAQRYNASGVAQGSEFRVNTYTTNVQSNPAVAMDGDGDFVVTWESNGQDGSGYGVYGKRFNASGVAQGSEFRVSTATANDQRDSAVAMDGNGNFMVTWASYAQDGNDWGVYGQQYSSSGQAIGDEFWVNQTTSGLQWLPAVAMNDAGQCVVVWGGLAGDNEGVFAQRYAVNNASGLHNLEAGVPHGYGPDGCDHDHADDVHHDEITGDETPCGCGTCALAVMDARSPIVTAATHGQQVAEAHGPLYVTTPAAKHLPPLLVGSTLTALEPLSITLASAARPGPKATPVNPGEATPSRGNDGPAASGSGASQPAAGRATGVRGDEAEWEDASVLDGELVSV